MKKISVMVCFLCMCLAFVCCNSGNVQASLSNESKREVQLTQNEKSEVTIIPEYYTTNIDSKLEYNWFLLTNKVPDNFVKYKDIKQIGKFDDIVLGGRSTGCSSTFDYSRYHYCLIDESGAELTLYVDSNPEDDTVIEAETITAVNESDMRYLEEDLRGHYTVDGMTYAYVSGKLLSIEWVSNGITYTLCGSMNLSDYPDITSTFVSKLLNLETAAETLNDFFDVVVE